MPKMTSAEHYNAAEKLLAEAESSQEPDTRAEWCLALAKMHLALSLAGRKPRVLPPPGAGQAQTGSAAGTGGWDPGSSEGSTGWRHVRGEDPWQQVPSWETSPPPGRGTPRQRTGSPAVRTPRTARHTAPVL